MVDMFVVAVVVAVSFTAGMIADGPDAVHTIISFFSFFPNPLIARGYDDRLYTYVNCGIGELSSRAFTPWKIKSFFALARRLL